MVIELFTSELNMEIRLQMTEKERVRLAGDLHDVVLQELIVIHRGLRSVLKESLPEETHGSSLFNGVRAHSSA